MRVKERFDRGKDEGVRESNEKKMRLFMRRFRSSEEMEVSPVTVDGSVDDDC